MRLELVRGVVWEERGRCEGARAGGVGGGGAEGVEGCVDGVVDCARGGVGEDEDRIFAWVRGAF